jgi:hypothetical protein
MRESALPSKITWSVDFIVLEGDTILPRALARLDDATEKWVVVRRYDGQYLYAFTIAEILRRPGLKRLRDNGADLTTMTVEQALELHEEEQSTKTTRRSAPPAIDRSWRPGIDTPSVDRYVEAGSNDVPRAVGFEAAKRRSRSTRNGGGRVMRGMKANGGTAVSTGSTVIPPLSDDEGTTPSVLPVEDEGTTPMRYPSIESKGEITAGGRISIVVDLLREPTDATEGGAVVPGKLAPNWESLQLSVILTCSAITFDAGGRDTVIIQRNAESTAATIEGRVSDDVAPGAVIIVMAEFYMGTRFCGSARRSLRVGTDSSATARPAAATSEGRVVVEPAAIEPDLTVHISIRDPSRPSVLYWQVITKRFGDLPPRLDATIDLGMKPSEQAATLFNTFATLERGKHRDRIHSFGTELWTLAPSMFRDVYWAVWDHYQRPLKIQFISDDPHIPWELMRPARADDSEIHLPLAVAHPVARWIKRWDGHMPNSIPVGPIFTIAPKYPSLSRSLPRAQVESALLVKDFSATRVDGTLQAVVALLKSAAGSDRVAILHFAGHGTFTADVARNASIKLEDGELTASEVAVPEVQLGKNSRTLVFFNACEVGATGAVFGEVGGWADALLGRQFGGFVAPLWSVDDEDASIVATELLDGIVRQQRPVADVIRGVREKHGDTSPTFYSYLFYGDVTAHLSA